MRFLRGISAFFVVLVFLSSRSEALEKHSKNGEPLLPPCIHHEVAAKERADIPLHSIHRKMSTAPASAAAVFNLSTAPKPPFQPLRIGVYDEDLFNTDHFCQNLSQIRPDFKGGTARCTADGILTTARRNGIIQELMPRAIGMHQERLSVPRAPILPVNMAHTGPVCRSFTVPYNQTIHVTTDVDFLLYIAAGAGGSELWGMSCLYGSDGRPHVGVVNLPARYGDVSDTIIRGVAHHIAHALGFDVDIFKNANMVMTTSVRGKPNVNLVVSPTVVSWVREFYSCDDVRGMDLEDNPVQPSIPIGWLFSSHHRFISNLSTIEGSDWKARNAHDDLMSFFSFSHKYSSLTLAAFSSLGFYSADFDKAEKMIWGLHVGCTLFTQACIQDGVSMVPSLFCTEDEKRYITQCAATASCTTDHMGMATCGAITYETDLPELYQYFPNHKKGGVWGSMDFCPIRETVYLADCGSLSANLSGSVFGPNARCFAATSPLGIDITNKIKCKESAICAEVLCNSEKTSYQVKVLGGAWIDCPERGTAVLSTSPFLSGTIFCPPVSTICTANTTPTLPLFTSSEASSLCGKSLTSTLVAILVVLFTF